MPEHRSLPWRATAALIRPHARRYSLLIAVVVANSALVLTGPAILATLIDRGAEGAARADLLLLAGAFLAVAVVSQLAAVSVAYLSTSVAWETANTLRYQMAEHVLGLDHEFHRSHSPGELVQRVDGDVSSVSDFLAIVFVRSTSALIIVGGVIGIVAVIDWRVGVAMTLYVAATAVVIYRQRHTAVAESANEMSASARLLGGIEERLTASEDLRANGAGAYAVHRFVEDTGLHVRSVLDRERSALYMWRRLQASVTIGATLALVGGAIAVERGVLTIGTAFLLYQYSQQIRRPLEDFINDLETVQKANGAMLRVIQLLAISTTIPDADQSGTARSPDPGPLAVSFDDVSFHYGDGQAVVDRVDLEVAAGRSVGIVGHSGSGKTTVSRLLVRLIDATSGEIRLGGVPIRDIGKDELRRRVAVVPQTVELMKGSIRDNLTLFDERITDAAVDRALEAVGLNQFRGEARNGVLGPGGLGLSAGEGQLLALGRVWLRDPDLVVLDEATARVDPATEAELERAIATLFENRSVFVIAHRLSTLRQVDEIVVVEEGRIVEHGPRPELEASPESRYRELLLVARGTAEGSSGFIDDGLDSGVPS
ncbi:MAG: ABC transporter ATP-binding protein/permease [Acidimicrobiia bacterium]|nr:ABC transporter ATP-binding protein/permease [Acidimicrobiia bacterium]